MTKRANALWAILKNIIYIGFGIQMVLGVIWMCCNITKNQAFTGQGGKLFLLLEPVLLCCPFLVYVLQLLLAFYASEKLAGALFFQNSQDKWKKHFAAAALVTFPFALQCHLAIAPFSVVSSLFLLELSEVISMLLDKDTFQLKTFVRASGCWLVMALLLPGYMFPGLAVIVVGLLCAGKRVKLEKKLIKALILLAASAGVLLAAGSLMQENKLIPHREQIAYSLCSRMTWPTMAPDSERWPEELKKATKGYYWETSLYADNMEQVFRKELRDFFGEEKAVEYYKFMAKDSWERHDKYILRQIIGDAAAYMVSPVILPIQLKGKAYVSYTGRNIEMFLMQAPTVSKFYVDYSCLWFVVVLVTLFIGAILWIASGQVLWKQLWKILCVLLAAVGLLTFIYTFRGAGIMDYKCTVSISLLWLLGALGITIGREEKA